MFWQRLTRFRLKSLHVIVIMAIIVTAGATSVTASGTALSTLSTGAPCAKDVLFIGARGSGEQYSENDGLGPAVKTTWTLLHNRLGDRVQMYALPYEALPVESLFSKKGERDLFQSVETGRLLFTGTIRNRIRAWREAGCSTPLKILTAGYSQGAWVIGDGIHSLGNDERNLIAGIVLLGDPEYNHTSSVTRGEALDGIAGARVPYVPAGMANRMRSLCHDGDGVCNFTNRRLGVLLGACRKPGANGYTCAHFGYANPGPEAQFAGNYLANRITG